MKLGLRARLLGTVVGAIVLLFLIVMISVRTTLSNDLRGLASAQVGSGADAMLSILRNHSERTFFVLQQAAGEKALLAAIRNRDAAALREIAQTIAEPNDLSYVTIVDAKGNVLARAGGPPGGREDNQMVRDALRGTGDTGYVRLDAAQAASEYIINAVYGATGAQPTIALQSSVPVFLGPHVAGAIEGGSVFRGANKIIGDVASFTGGQAAVSTTTKITASSLQDAGGTTLQGTPISQIASALKGERYRGLDRENGLTYFAQIDPLRSFDGKTIGATWFGVPYEKLALIERDATRSIFLWSIIGLVIAVGVAIVVVNRIAAAIIASSEQVSESARALDVLVVGTEASNDHVTQARRRLETVGELLERVVPVTANGEGMRLRALAKEATGDIIVIDTLAGELNGRMRGAVDRVAELNDVVDRLTRLVNGSLN